MLVNNVAALLEGELANGVDDNGNGLIDEAGFCVSREGENLTVRLSLLRLGPAEEVITRTQTTELALRN